MNTEERLRQALQRVTPDKVFADKQTEIPGYPAIVYWQVGSDGSPIQAAFQDDYVFYTIDIRCEKTAQGLEQRRRLDWQVREELECDGLLISPGTTRTRGDDLEGTDTTLRLMRTVMLWAYE